MPWGASHNPSARALSPTPPPTSCSHPTTTTRRPLPGSAALLILRLTLASCRVQGRRRNAPTLPAGPSARVTLTTTKAQRSSLGKKCRLSLTASGFPGPLMQPFSQASGVSLIATALAASCCFTNSHPVFVSHHALATRSPLLKKKRHFGDVHLKNSLCIFLARRHVYMWSF